MYFDTSSSESIDLQREREWPADRRETIDRVTVDRRFFLVSVAIPKVRQWQWDIIVGRSRSSHRSLASRIGNEPTSDAPCFSSCRYRWSLCHEKVSLRNCLFVSHRVDSSSFLNSIVSFNSWRISTNWVCCFVSWIQTRIRESALPSSRKAMN